MQTRIIERYFFFGLLSAIFFFTFMIFRPFWVVLVLGISFSIVLHPIYVWLTKHKISATISSLLTVILFLFLIWGPLLGIGTIAFNQSEGAYDLIVQDGSVEPFLASMEEQINKFLPEVGAINLKEQANEFTSYVSGNVTEIFSATISAFFSFLLILLIMFYFLKDGEGWRKAVIALSPLGDKDDEKIISILALSVNTVIRGYLLIALVQGILMGFGLWIFNVPNFALWGVVAAVSSMLPMIGTALISIPAIIFLLLVENIAGAIGLLVWSIVVVGMVDNFLNPMIIGRKINIPPILVLFSILGGISLLGPVGILVGPLVVSLLYTLISIYKNEFMEDAQKNATL